MSGSRVLDAMNLIWLVGLGVLSKAQKDGQHLFWECVEEGQQVQHSTLSEAVRVARGVRDNLEARLNETIARLPPMQVLKEIRALRKRVDAVETKIDNLAVERPFRSSAHRRQRPVIASRADTPASYSPKV